tara:strand:+ start:1679 stop:1888 length:210 start_codon:yes stop_codon:yes gene_type:complete
MYDWMIKHQKECKINDSDKCNECFHISEAQWALTEAYEEKQENNNKPKPKPKPQTKLEWDYRLGEWMEE